MMEACLLNKLYLPGDRLAPPAEENPKEAATVILVRQAKDSWKIFLARRHRGQSFMAGAFVFPGGRLEQSDSDPELACYMEAPGIFNPQALLQDAGLTPDLARAFFAAAIRETFEEAGILFACDEKGNFITFRNDEDVARVAAHRRALNSGQMSFAEIIRKEKIFLFPEALIPYSHWITPKIAAKRFDTRFFLARLPEGQEPVSDCAELTELLWVAPREALLMQSSGKITLMPPTLKTVMELAEFESIDELFAAAKKRVIYTILPQEFEKGVKLPHDPEYGLEQYRRPANPTEPSRIILEDGVWRAAFYEDKKASKSNN
jgi:8-oxo-dGTP pyrophosphatase MutT (NUDIX family)